MRTEGFLAPETDDEARAIYEDLGPAAQEVTRAVALAIGLDADEYRESVDEEVIGTTREALFGSLLAVRTGDREAFDDWLESPEAADLDVTVEGSENVAHVAWHAAPVADRVLAATYADERAAAIATLRRMAWGRIYRERLLDEDST